MLETNYTTPFKYEKIARKGRRKNICPFHIWESNVCVTFSDYIQRACSEMAEKKTELF